MAGPTPRAGAGEALPTSIVPDPDDASWSALQKELETPDEVLGGEEEPPLEEDAEPEIKTREEAEPKAKPTYEELDRNYKNTTTALRQAREQAKADREQLTNITRLIEQLREGRQQRQQEAEPPARAEPPQPSVDEDPIGYFKAELAKAHQAIQHLQQGTQQTVQEVTQRQQFTDFVQAVERSEIAMRASAPDYDAACEHLEKGRISELEIMLPDNSPQAMALARQAGLASPEQLRMQMLNNDRIAVARQALQLGRSPAEVYYNLAKSRGYAAKANGQQRTQNGQFKTKELEQAEMKIETARRGQKAARSIGGGSGSSENPLNANDLVDMYEEAINGAGDEAWQEFDRAWERARRSGALG